MCSFSFSLVKTDKIIPLLTCGSCVPGGLAMEEPERSPLLTCDSCVPGGLAMEEPETNLGQQLPNGPDTEIDVTDFMVLDCDKEGKFYVKQDAKGEQQPSGGLSPMDVDLKGIPSVVDEGKVKSSSDPSAQVPIDFNSASLEKFCKEAARSFFTEKGLISHQINSYNDFISHELQELFDSIGEITVEPDYDPSKRVGDWRHATVKFGRVELEKPTFWADNSDLDEQKLRLKPVHARLQNMTYSSKMNVEMTVQVRMLPSPYSMDNYTVFGTSNCTIYTRKGNDRLSHAFIGNLKLISTLLDSIFYFRSITEVNA